MPFICAACVYISERVMKIPHDPGSLPSTSRLSSKVYLMLSSASVVSNVADGSRSYRVLAQIGCEDRQIRHSVMAQQAVFFLFPLAVGLAHSFVALKVIIELVSIFENMSIGGTVGLTCAIFLAAYGGYFLVTYLMSTGMVRAAIATRYSE